MHITTIFVAVGLSGAFGVLAATVVVLFVVVLVCWWWCKCRGKSYAVHHSACQDPDKDPGNTSKRANEGTTGEGGSPDTSLDMTAISDTSATSEVDTTTVLDTTQEVSKSWKPIVKLFGRYYRPLYKDHLAVSQ